MVLLSIERISSSDARCDDLTRRLCQRLSWVSRMIGCEPRAYLRSWRYQLAVGCDCRLEWLHILIDEMVRARVSPSGSHRIAAAMATSPPATQPTASQFPTSAAPQAAAILVIQGEASSTTTVAGITAWRNGLNAGRLRVDRTRPHLSRPPVEQDEHDPVGSAENSEADKRPPFCPCQQRDNHTRDHSHRRSNVWRLVLRVRPRERRGRIPFLPIA